jgi:serine/threonine protein kinase
LGSNEILTPIGAGGMGEVYRTRDTKLTRDVAIKVLPAALSNDGDYMARFQREDIAAIYDLEDHAIVMGSRADRVSSARRQTDRGNPRSSP